MLLDENCTSDPAENIHVFVRVRPESLNEPIYIPVLFSDSNNKSLIVQNGTRTESFQFDGTFWTDSPQSQLFEKVALPACHACIQGYNSTIFAYGQTATGKTFTIQGPTNEEGNLIFDKRGLIPRSFEYIFSQVRSSNSIKFLIRCSFVEIYNESVFDLLANDCSFTCSLREDTKRGVYIEGNLEEIVTCENDALKIFEKGIRNRHVSSTLLNHESSRSHAIFTLLIQSVTEEITGIEISKVSKFNFVDLAGSERQQHTGTLGLRLKEAGNINKSLLALTNVINGLADIQNGKNRHVQYRDSKLTFLLRDSLGGNSKTTLIATVSNNPNSYAETVSTLRFAQRAKSIRNNVYVNSDLNGDVNTLKEEIKRLRQFISDHGEDNLKQKTDNINENVDYIDKEIETEDGLAQNAVITSLVKTIKILEKTLISSYE